MTLKDWFTGDIDYNSDGQFIVIQNPKFRHICDIRGWGEIQKLFKNKIDAENFQDSIGEFICEAIKEKVEKELKDNG